MKNKLNKAKEILSVVRDLTIIIAGFIVLIAFSFGAMSIVLAITAISLCVAVTIHLITSAIELIQKCVEISKSKKELDNKRKEYSKYKSKNYKYQKDYAIKRANTIQAIKDKDNEIVYAEEFVEVDDKELDVICEHTLNENDKNIINEYREVKNQLQDKTNKFKLERLEELKQKLTRLSFQVQDIASIHNMFLEKYETPKEIYKNKEKINKLKLSKKM